MAKVSKVCRKFGSRRHRVTPYPLPSDAAKVLKDVHQKKKGSKAAEKKEWDHATCSVCMEYPHNAVLLLCSSYDKGCRPYMCATSNRYSNCLEQYKKAYTKVTKSESSEPWDGSVDDSGGYGPGSGCLDGKSELLCPLCRGQVKGWTVVESAREYLNTKRRSCMQDKCWFVGTYKQLRKHARTKHPWARPRKVDPSVADKWRRLEHEREREDVISTIRSSMPGAIVMGDYVIERNFDEDYLDDGLFENGILSWDEEDVDEEEMHHRDNLAGRFVGNFISRITPRRPGRFGSGRVSRRRRRRSAAAFTDR